MTTDAKLRNPSGKRRIFVVDDHPVVRKGLAQLIAQEADIEVCGGAEGETEALQQIKTLLPDLVVVDISLKEGHGIDLIVQLKATLPNVKTLVWSMFDEKLFAERALRAGAMGYINKQHSIEKAIDAIRQVLNGELYVSPEMTGLLLRRVGEGEGLDEDPLRRLTNRELEVFELIGKGITTRQIGRMLGISQKTAETHREKIKTKLGLKNSSELARRAVQWVLENG